MTRLALSMLFALVALGAAPVVRAEGGLQVEVDPATGAYSMPAPGRLPETAARAVVGDDVVITPGRTAAGGFKATRRDALELQQAGPAANPSPALPPRE
jgi:hypothetical protein